MKRSILDNYIVKIIFFYFLKVNEYILCFIDKCDYYIELVHVLSLIDLRGNRNQP